MYIFTNDKYNCDPFDFNRAPQRINEDTLIIIQIKLIVPR